MPTGSFLACPEPLRKVPKFSREGLNSEEFAAQHSRLRLPRVGSRRGGATADSRGPPHSRPRAAQPSTRAPRGNRAAVAGAFVRAEQAPKGSAGFPAPALTTAGPLPPSPATPSRPALRRLPELTFWMAAGVISPLPRCLGAANATDMLPPSPRSASPERSGGRGAGGPTPASRAGPPERAPRGERGSGAARIAGRARLGAEPQLPARRLGSSSRPGRLRPRAPPPARLSLPAVGRHPRARALMVAPRRPPPPGRSGNGPAAAGGSCPAALSQETRGPPAKLSPTAPATLRGRDDCPESSGPPPRGKKTAWTRERLPGRQRERGFAGLNGSLRSTCAPWSRSRARKV